MELELYYDSAWNTAPVYDRDGCTVMRGTSSTGNDTEPASGSLTIDNRSEDYSPRSLASPLHGKIRQNTPARITVDGDPVLTGEAALWKPERDVGGDAWTKLEVAGVLRRIGRGKAPFRSPLRRAYSFEPPDRYWPLDDPKDTVDAAGSSPMVRISGTAEFATENGVAGASSSVWVGKDANGVDNFGGSFRSTFSSDGFSDTGWQVEFSARYQTSTAGSPSVIVSVLTSGGSSGGVINFILGTGAWDGLSHHASFWLYPDGSDVKADAYRDGVFIGTQTVILGDALGVPVGVEINRSGASEPETLPALSAVALYSTFHDPAERGLAGGAWLGETAGNRFLRVCAEQGITATVVGDPDETVVMGPQGTDSFLEILDEIARTDDALIFETKDSPGLTMRTGYSRLNTTPDLTISYIGEIVPPLRPELGDRGIRNDVTASGPVGADQQVEQLTGPRNVQAPEDDPQGVGRYATSLKVNPSTVDGIRDSAGWRVNQGTYDGTWYSEITVDLDAAPHLTAAVAAVDIGFMLELTDLPVDESLDDFLGIIVGIRESPKTHRRTVTLYCVPAAPYMVGVLSETTGDTDPFLGHADTDGSTTIADTAVGAATFSVATPTGPLWTTVADDFPLDIIVGEQRVSISAISGASSPQTFTVQPGGYQVVYAIPAGSLVNVHQGLTPTL